MTQRSQPAGQSCPTQEFANFMSRPQTFSEIYPDHAALCLDIIGSRPGIFLLAGASGQGKSSCQMSLVRHLVADNHPRIQIEPDLETDGLPRTRNAEQYCQLINSFARSGGDCIVILPNLRTAFDAEVAVNVARYNTVIATINAPTARAALQRMNGLLPDISDMQNVIGVMAQVLLRKPKPLEDLGRFALTECLDLRDGSAPVLAVGSIEEHYAAFADLGLEKVAAGKLELEELKRAFHRLPLSYWQGAMATS